jgi:hypothetical protein
MVSAAMETILRKVSFFMGQLQRALVIRLISRPRCQVQLEIFQRRKDHTIDRFSIYEGPAL